MDGEVMAAALAAMKHVTQSINELKRQHERSLRAVEIQRLLDGWSSVELALLGQLVMEVRLLMTLFCSLMPATSLLFCRPPYLAKRTLLPS